MPVSVLDTTFVVEELTGVSAHRVVARGAQSAGCKYYTAAAPTDILGITQQGGALDRAVAVRRLGKALVEAAQAVAAGERVCVADAQGRVKPAPRASGTTGGVGANNAIRWTAPDCSLAGNTVVVDIVVSGNNTAFALAVSGNTLQITAATNESGQAVTTAAQALAAVAASAAASRIVAAASETGSTGAGALADETITLGGAEGARRIVGVAEQSASAPGDLIDVFLAPGVC